MVNKERIDKSENVRSFHEQLVYFRFWFLLRWASKQCETTPHTGELYCQTQYNKLDKHSTLFKLTYTVVQQQTATSNLYWTGGGWEGLWNVWMRELNQENNWTLESLLNSPPNVGCYCTNIQSILYFYSKKARLQLIAWVTRTDIDSTWLIFLPIRSPNTDWY